MTISSDRVCAICKQKEADDTLEEERPVHANCVLLGKHMAVTVRFWMEQDSLLLKKDEGLQFAFDMMQKASDISTFRTMFGRVCQYLLELKDKIEKVIAAYRRQRAVDEQAKRRLSIMETAVEKICETFETLQIIAEEHLLDQLDPARLLGRPVRERELSFESPEAIAIAG